SKESADARLYHRDGEHQGCGEIRRICETSWAGERQARQPLPRAWRQEDRAGGRHPVRAHRRQRISGRRGGEEVLQLGGVPGCAQASPRCGRLSHGDRRGRAILRLIAAALLWPALALGAVDSKDAAFLGQGYRLFGTLTVPAAPRAAVLIIPGTGPLDRDGSSKAAPQVPPVYKMWAERLGD